MREGHQPTYDIKRKNEKDLEKQPKKQRARSIHQIGHNLKYFLFDLLLYYIVIVIKLAFVLLFSARQHICYSTLFAIARPSVRPSVCPSVPLSVTGGSVKDGSRQDYAIFTTEQPHDSSFLTRNGTLKFQREHRERGRRIREGYEKYAIFSQ